MGAVSYLNTKPLIYGLEQGMMQDELELVLDFPANIARQLLNDQIDIGLVPVAILPELDSYSLVSDYGIACNGPVASVCLFSEVPVSEIAEVLMDYQSRTSVQLARILLRDYWKVDPVITETKREFADAISGKTAGVIIGDRALKQRGHSSYCYDLGEAWKAHTSLPFVFAAWVSNKPIDPGFIQRFNAANEFGLKHIREIIEVNPESCYPLEKYFRENIEFKLDDQKKAGLSLFLDILQKN